MITPSAMQQKLPPNKISKLQMLKTVTEVDSREIANECCLDAKRQV